VGFVPLWVAEREARAGRLRRLDVEGSRPEADLYVAWRTGEQGKALEWFARRLEDPRVAAELLS
jgi:DNA-binding transcriptional LysR family regulator